MRHLTKRKHTQRGVGSDDGAPVESARPVPVSCPPPSERGLPAGRVLRHTAELPLQPIEDAGVPSSGRRKNTRPMVAPEADSTRAATNAIALHGVSRVKPQRLVASPKELSRAPLSSRDAFLLSFVDGTASVTALVDASGMPEEEVVAILDRLCALNIVSIG